MATLAQDLQNRGIRLIDPYKEGTITGREEEEEEDSDNEEYFEEEEEEEEEIPEPPEVTRHVTMPPKSTTPKKKKALSVRECLSPNHVNLKVSGPVSLVKTAYAAISYPMLSGKWEDMDSNYSFTTKCMIRMIVHNGIHPQHVQMEWINDRLLKISLLWPDWFMQIAQMMEFNTIPKADGLGDPVPVYGLGHELTRSMIKCVIARKDKDNKISDEGYFSFDEPMDTRNSNISIEVLNVKVGSGIIHVLQIVTLVAVPEEEKPSAFSVTARSTKTSSGSGKTPENVRRRDYLEDEMDETQEEAEAVGTGEAAAAATEDRKSKKSRLPFQGVQSSSHGSSASALAIHESSALAIHESSALAITTQDNSIDIGEEIDGFSMPDLSDEDDMDDL